MYINFRYIIYITIYLNLKDKNENLLGILLVLFVINSFAEESNEVAIEGNQEVGEKFATHQSKFLEQK